MKKKSVKKEQFTLRGEYKKSFVFLKKSRHFIYIAILLFFIFVALGFFFEDLINLFFKTFFNINLNDQIIEYIRVLLLKTEGMSGKELVGFIFVNNLQSSFFGLILGILIGLFPLVALISNGYLLGFVAMLSIESQGIGILWRLLPHGVFELPAVFISLGLGLKLGMYIFIKKRSDSFKGWFLNSLRVFVLIVFPLLIIAAVIEGFLIVLTG